MKPGDLLKVRKLAPDVRLVGLIIARAGSLCHGEYTWATFNGGELLTVISIENDCGCFAAHKKRLWHRVTMMSPEGLVQVHWDSMGCEFERNVSDCLTWVVGAP